MLVVGNLCTILVEGGSRVELRTTTSGGGREVRHASFLAFCGSKIVLEI